MYHLLQLGLLEVIFCIVNNKNKKQKASFTNQLYKG